MQTPRGFRLRLPFDVWLFLFCIPLISAFNYVLTYPNIQPNAFLLLSFSLDTAQGWLAWLGVRYAIRYMDRVWPIEQWGMRRVLRQLGITTVIGVLIISILTELVSWVARGRGASPRFYTHDLLIISIWFPAINGYYIGQHFYQAWKRLHVTPAPSEQSQPATAPLRVQYGKQELLLEPEEIAGLYVEGDYVAICHREGKRYYSDQSLDKLESSLPADLFFRLNRQYLIHRRLIAGFRRVENGKILVQVRPHEGLPQEVPVSRTKAPAFRSWLRIG